MSGPERITGLIVEGLECFENAHIIIYSVIIYNCVSYSMLLYLL